MYRYLYIQDDLSLSLSLYIYISIYAWRRPKPRPKGITCVLAWRRPKPRPALKHNNAIRSVQISIYIYKPHEAHGSDTFGLVRAHDGKWHLTQVTARYPDVVKLLTSWIEGQAYSKHVLAIIDALSKRCSVEIKARVRG
jgi:hypothetical protein